MALDIREFNPSHNADILNAIRDQASSDYQRRIPAATKARVQDTMQLLWDHRPSRNEFVDALINRIGLVIARNNSWTNPLAKFKQGMLQFGDTIEEVQVGLVEANVYEHDRDYLERVLFGHEMPEVQSRFHKINREEFYKITVKEFALQRAFLTPEGISSFIVQLMEAPTTSDNWDEFLITTSLFREYERSAGFFKTNIPNISDSASDGNDARYTLRRLRETADNLTFLSRHYNAAHMPVTADREDLELFITPEANAALDVEALAGAFNIDKANFASRTTVIPKEYFGIEGAQAILTTRNFFVIADTRFETASVMNPAGLYNNYFLHHHSIVSASPFVPAILFTTQPGDVINILDTPVIDVAPLSVQNRGEVTVTDVERGEIYYVSGAAITDPSGGLNDAVRFTLKGATSERTYLAQTGYLSVALDEAATTLTITATSVDDNDFSESITLNVVGTYYTIQPAKVHEDADKDGLIEVTPTEPKFDTATDTVTIPTVSGVQYRMDGVDVADGSENVITIATTFTAVARAGYEIATGATASWTFTP